MNGPKSASDRWTDTAHPGICDEASPIRREFHCLPVMKQELHTLRRAAGLLLAATALPHTALLAQETQPAAPVVVAPPPAPIVTAPAPVAVQPAPAPVPAPAPAPTMEPIFYQGPPPEETPAASAPERPRAARVTPRPRAAAPAPEPTVEAAPAPAFTPAPITDAPATSPMAELPAPPPIVAEPASTAEPAQAARPAGLAWLWLFAAALAAVAAILLFRRRRRPHDDFVHAPREQFDDANMVTAGAPAIAPLAYEAAPAAAATAAAAAATTERASLELQMRPVRAGVTDDDAVVEFELTIDNQGSGAARDVRISTWMFPAGSPRSEMESLLIEPDAEADLIGAGDRRSFETQVALPTAGIAQDSVLPVVVAEARYRLEDGSEQHTSASFAVGVPLGDELAHFDLENPSGLHEGVEARPLREPQDA